MSFLSDFQIDPANTPSSRRSLLTKSMQNLEGKKIDCANCTGTCCTYVANSMQITPLEALEIIEGLKLTALSRSELKKKLSQTVIDYRLDQELMTGKRGIQNFRRTFTCPFFTPGPKGCGLSRSTKPYGCLAFNPRLENDNGSQCSSDHSLLDKRNDEFKTFEDEANVLIAAHFSLHWKKLDLPRALLFFLNHPLMPSPHE